MSVLAVQNLCRQWFGDPSMLEESLNSAFDCIGFTDAYVDGLLSRQTRGGVQRKTKVIKDAVWGMIEVRHDVLKLLDSPLLQRLRNIKQLGFSYLTYPSAEHSRFVHSLGMSCVVSRFLDAMKHQPDHMLQEDTIPGFVIDKPTMEEEIDLLHAAILHDVGHLPFSHVPERIITELSMRFTCGKLTVDDFAFAVEEQLEKKLKLAECLSLALVLSPRFKRFYSQYVRPENGQDGLCRVAALIAGLPPRPDRRAVADLISSTAVDADKIDFLNRDAQACGIPVGLDVSRIFLRSCFLKVRNDLLQDILQGGAFRTGDTTIFIVNSSGVDTIEEMRHARAALYQRVYLHQTTRNAERLLEKSFDLLSREDERREELTDVLSLWKMDEFQLLSVLKSHSSASISRIANAIANRELPKRSAAFGPALLAPVTPLTEIFPDSLSDGDHRKIITQVYGTSLENLREDNLAGSILAELESRVLENVHVIIEKLSPDFSDLLPPGREPPEYVTILPIPGLERSRAGDCVVFEHGMLYHSSKRTTADEQSEAADISKALGYVLADADWREIVAIATRKTLYDYSNEAGEVSLPLRGGVSGETIERSLAIRFLARLCLDSPAYARRSGADVSKIERLTAALAQTNYFDSAPRLVPYTGDEARMQRIASSLRVFSGQDGWSVTHSTVVDFIEQFPPKFRAAAVALLDAITILDRRTCTGLLRRALLGVPQSEGRRILTSLSPNSGAFVRMLLEQDYREELNRDGWKICKTINDALGTAKPGDTLVLCDDNLASGSQAQCQFRAWHGDPRSNWPSALQGEQGIEDIRLRDNDLELLKKLKIGIAVCLGSKESEERLRALFSDRFGLEFLGIFFGESVSSSAELGLEFETYLKDIGTQLLFGVRGGGNPQSGEIDHTLRESCEHDALGYGGLKGVNCTPFNVPTSTIPALWCPGIVNGEAWVPLLIRRGYLRHFVLG